VHSFVYDGDPARDVIAAASPLLCPCVMPRMTATFAFG
jgi:hypothetical protein